MTDSDKNPRRNYTHGEIVLAKLAQIAEQHGEDSPEYKEYLETQSKHPSVQQAADTLLNNLGLQPNRKRRRKKR